MVFWHNTEAQGAVEMPIGHQVNLLVFGPGGYCFVDYTWVGEWLNLVLLILTALVLPLIWPLTR
jgi:di/tricarboxylate transporter